MKILLLAPDSKIENFALAKIRKYHLDKGDYVIDNQLEFFNDADKVYLSCVFTKTKESIEKYSDKAIIGGTGWDLKSKLPECIESIKPRINLGFTTRGCIRNCKFCVVKEKEGYIHRVGSLLDLWDGKSKDILVMDNNILALPDHFESVAREAVENKIRVDFNQGLDFRLLSPKILELLKSMRRTELRFAFDNIKYMDQVEDSIRMLQNYGFKRNMWYVLVGFDSSFEEDIKRLNILKFYKQNAFVQRYESVIGMRRYTRLAQWANQHHIFAKMSFSEFLDKRYGGKLE